MRRTCVLSVLFFMLVSVSVFLSDVQAATQLGGLMRGDVTDPTDSINVSGVTYAPATWADNFSVAKWENIYSSTSNPYTSSSKGESPVSLFENNSGTGNTMKWFDNVTPTASAPAYVTVQFPEAFVMTHFTLTSAGDSWEHGRQPKTWTVYGSNDGETWNMIYNADSVDKFTSSNSTTMLYSSFTNDTLSSTVLNQAQQGAVTASLGNAQISAADFTNNTAYSWYKLEITSTNNNGATQLGEWEIYGNTVNRVATKGNGLSVNLNAVYSLDAQNINSITTDAEGNVTAWADTNSNGVIFSANKDANYDNSQSLPNLATIDINGKTFNAIDFTKYTDKSAEHPTAGDLLSANQTIKAQTIFILANNDIDANLTGIWGQYGDEGIRLNQGTGLWQGYNNGNGGDIGKGGQLFFDGTDVAQYTGKLKDQTVLSQVVTPSVKTFSDNTIGGYFSANMTNAHGIRAYDGQIMEVMVFDRTLSDWETKLVNTMFATKYGMDIANTLDIFASSTDGSVKYNKELLGIINKNGIFQGSTGDGGLSINGIALETTADAAFDIFGNYVQPTAGTEIYAVSNTDSAFSVQTMNGIKMSSYDAWAKEWYISNFSDAAEAWDMMLTFSEEDALFNGEGVADDAEWSLLYRDSVDGEYSMVANLDAKKFADGVLFFTMSSDMLQTGFYTLGIQTTPEVPEPATWALLLFGASTLLVVKRRNSSRS